MTFPWFLVKSLTAIKFPDISRFSRQVVTLHVAWKCISKMFLNTYCRNKLNYCPSFYVRMCGTSFGLIMLAHYVSYAARQSMSQFKIWKICHRFLKQNFICSTVFFSVWTHGTRRQKLQEEEWCDRKFDDIQTSIHPDISHLYYNLHCLQAVAELTSSSAVTKRLCDASCLSVVSFNCTIPRVQFFQLLVYNSILFCCLRHNVEPCCHTHDSQMTVTVYSAKLHLVGRTLYSCGWPWLLIASGAWSTDSRSQQKPGHYVN